MLSDLVDDLSKLFLVNLVRLLLLLLILLILHQEVVHVDTDGLVIPRCFDISDAQGFWAVSAS